MRQWTTSRRPLHLCRIRSCIFLWLPASPPFVFPLLPLPFPSSGVAGITLPSNLGARAGAQPGELPCGLTVVLSLGPRLTGRPRQGPAPCPLPAPVAVHAVAWRGVAWRGMARPGSAQSRFNLDKGTRRFHRTGAHRHFQTFNISIFLIQSIA